MIALKRHGNLWSKIISEENISQAIHKACKSNGRTSIDKKRKIAWLKDNEETAIIEIQSLLMSGKYKTSKYFIYPLYEPKLRFIYSLPFYPDRIIHHCFMIALEPIWDRLMCKDSYACRKGKGQHRAGLECTRLTQTYKYVLKCDVSQFYIAINHDILKTVLVKKIKDKRVLQFLYEIIDSMAVMQMNYKMLSKMKEHGATHRDVYQSLAKLETYANVFGDKQRGIPTGNYTSQWFGNLYMNELDTFIKQVLNQKNYIRFCDDFLIFSDSKEELVKVATCIKNFCYGRLELLLSKCNLFPTSQGVEFCGYRYFPQGYTLLKKATALKKKREIKKVCTALENKTMPIEKARSIIASAYGLLKWGTTYNLIKKLRLDELQRKVIKECRNSAISQKSACL